jgi:hypothetical protein
LLAQAFESGGGGRKAEAQRALAEAHAAAKREAQPDQAAAATTKERAPAREGPDPRSALCLHILLADVAVHFSG